jgi:signal transduction histidine kinase
VLQVLGNLVGNAVKFSRSGDVVVLRCASGAEELTFSVTDHGPGIPERDIGHVFEPYWTADRTARRGTGLGLYISKGIVEAHGGRIWVETEIGEGTTVSFTLPVAAEREGPAVC